MVSRFEKAYQEFGEVFWREKKRSLQCFNSLPTSFLILAEVSKNSTPIYSQ